MKRHLAIQSRPPIRRGACGHEYPQQWTHDPAEVTCVRCQGTVRMADAEVEQYVIKKRSNRSNDQKGSAS